MRAAHPDFVDAAWFKSSFSGGNNGACVEAAFVPGAVGVRDSKQHGRGSVLLFTRDEWAAFLAATRAREFDQVL